MTQVEIQTDYKELIINNVEKLEPLMTQNGAMVNPKECFTLHTT